MSDLFKTSPLPWVVAADNAFDALSLPVIQLTPFSPAPLAEVVRRVNVHDDLLAAAENMLKSSAQTPQEVVEARRAAVVAAISKARR